MSTVEVLCLHWDSSAVIAESEAMVGLLIMLVT
jgi:hypothetical protein